MMIEGQTPLVFILRQGLFLVPLAATLFLVNWYRDRPRMLVAAFFAFLFQFGVMFALHIGAFVLGWWRFTGAELSLIGFPADIWIGGALLWGPVLYLVMPRVSPLLFVVPNALLNAVAMPVMAPVLVVGDGWMIGQVLVILLAMLPGQYLARWTADDRLLGWRAGLLALGYGVAAFFVMPTLIMRAMGGGWSGLLTNWPPVVTALLACVFGYCMIMGLAAVQLFALHGGGTPIPLDRTRRLVRTGLYAYLANPMQHSTAIAWVVLGIALMNIWIALGAGMAVLFVLGMVRWHHRYDLAVRFPEGLPEYRAHVPEWLPRWRPWVPASSTLAYGANVPAHLWFVRFLQRHGAVALTLTPRPGGGLSYRAPGERRSFGGVVAVAKALNHVNFAFAVVGALVLLVTLVGGALVGRQGSYLAERDQPIVPDDVRP